MLLIALVFVWRSFYAMRIPPKEEAPQAGAPHAGAPQVGAAHADAHDTAIRAG
jgi:hypothetical protein